jgi:hypothetical protein
MQKTEIKKIKPVARIMKGAEINQEGFWLGYNRGRKHQLLDLIDQIEAGKDAREVAYGMLFGLEG